MDYCFDEKIELILNKKFKSKIHSGYDPEDVDAFFDQVIVYIKQVQNLQQSFQSKIDIKDQEINLLKQKNEQLQSNIDELKKELEYYYENGYSNLRNKVEK